MTLKLHGFFRSGTSYRVRIALNLKGLPFETVAVDLRAGEHRSDAFRALNPQGFVPVLETNERLLIQSPAILEWLEETYPAPALLPAEEPLRSRVRAFSMVIGCDIHPIQNLRILNCVADLTPDKRDAREVWARKWIEEGFAALEAMANEGGAGGAGFLFGAAPGWAEIYLVPQMYNARRFGVDLAPFPRLVAADAAAQAMDEFADAHPDRFAPH